MASYNELNFEWSLLCGKDYRDWDNSGEFCFLLTLAIEAAH